jgi:hypothetical protein
MNGRFRTWVCVFQGVYFAATGVWSLVSIETFMLVTGRKTDVWLVKTVGALVIAIGATLLFAARRARITDETRFLAVACAVALAAIELVYVLLRTISPIYLLDAILEAVIAIAWFVPVKDADSTMPKDRSVEAHRVGP